MTPKIEWTDGPLNSHGKEKWPPGPWDSEPDYASATWRGMTLEIKRHSKMGHWRGYVKFPYKELVDEEYEEFFSRELFWTVKVGEDIWITYYNVKDRLEILGFEFANSTDISPFEGLEDDDDQTYKTMVFAKEHTELLASKIDAHWESVKSTQMQKLRSVAGEPETWANAATLLKRTLEDLK